MNSISLVFVLILSLLIVIVGFSSKYSISLRVPQQEIDYNSNEGFQTKTWGVLIWNFLHIISFNYKVNPTEQDKENYRSFVYSLRHVLPCKYCRDSFSEILKQYPLTDQVMESRSSFSRYIYDLHNYINVKTDKPIYSTYEQVRDFYE